MSFWSKFLYCIVFVLLTAQPCISLNALKFLFDEHHSSLALRLKTPNKYFFFGVILRYQSGANSTPFIQSLLKLNEVTSFCCANSFSTQVINSPGSFVHFFCSSLGKPRCAFWHFGLVTFVQTQLNIFGFPQPG